MTSEERAKGESILPSGAIVMDRFADPDLVPDSDTLILTPTHGVGQMMSGSDSE